MSDPDRRPGFEVALRLGGLVVCSGCRHFEARPGSRPDGWCRHFDVSSWQYAPFTCQAHEANP